MNIELDPHSSTPVWEQLVERFQFLIATGQFAAGERLPSTRSLADRLKISFHTVRKSYQGLVEAGLARTERGRGFVVTEYRPAAKQERMEQGATVMARTVEQLTAMGLDDSEMEYLFQEQLAQLGQSPEAVQVVFVASFTEFVERGAQRLGEYLGQEVEPVALSMLDGRTEVDYAIVPFPISRKVQEKLPRADVLGVRTELPPPAIALAARLFDHETLLLVVKYSDAIGPLTRRLRNDAGFNGQIIAVVVEEDDSRLGSLVRQADAVLFTPDTARRMRPHLAAAPAHAELELLISPSELERIRLAMPR